MSNYLNRNQLKVNAVLADFLEKEVIADLPISVDDFWQSMDAVIHDLGPENRALLAKRDKIQEQMDQWAISNRDNFDADEYKQFLYEIGYLVKEGNEFSITTENVDEEIAAQAGPQLVVPASNARFALNATNARWGSLYDALYGTDVISEEGGAEKTAGFNPTRGAKVIAYCRDLLDAHFELESGSHVDVTSYQVTSDGLSVTLENGNQTGLTEQAQCVGYQGDANSPSSILLKNNGLHISVEVDSNDSIGKIDKAGVKDLTVEAALTTIQDFEDSVAAVDAEDKVGIYRNWLGLMRGDLVDSFDKGGKTMIRSCAADKTYTTLDGGSQTLHGRSLLFCRNVGHLMSNPAILDKDGIEVQEGILDAMASVLIAMHDLNGLGQYRNSRKGSVYIVKPKMHGPDEVAFANKLFNRVEDEYKLPRHTIKIGVMDEERRTTVNLKECIRQVKDRVVFINTGFLDRTGDEIHTSMLLGAMAPKAKIKQMAWIHAYEDWNVDIGLPICALPGSPHSKPISTFQSS